MLRTLDALQTDEWLEPAAEPAAQQVTPSLWAVFDRVEAIGSLNGVYREIARRLPRNAYTSHGATL